MPKKLHTLKITETELDFILMALIEMGSRWQREDPFQKQKETKEFFKLGNKVLREYHNKKKAR